MTTRTQQTTRRCWVLSSLAVLVAVLAVVGLFATSSAATNGTAGTRVRASAEPAAVLVGPPEHISAGQRLGNDGQRVVTVVATGVAANGADEVADIGHAGLRHQFPNTLRGKSQFYDNVDLGGLASRTKGMDGFLQTNGNTRYVLRNPGGVGVDRTTGLPTDVFTVIRRPDGSVVTMFPGTSPKG